MKTLKFFAQIFLLLLMISCISGKHSDNKSEEIINDNHQKFVIQPEIHNFGNLESGDVVNFLFNFSNPGKEKIKIDSVISGCGCINAKFTNYVVNPGENEYLEVMFNSGGEWGNVFRPILIYSNTENRIDTIYITAKVNNNLFNN